MAETATSRGDTRNLLIRAGSALVLIPIAVLAIWAGGIPYLAIIVLVASLSLWEWLAICSPAAPLLVRGALTLLMAAGLLAGHFGYLDVAVPVLAGLPALALAASLLIPRSAWAGFGLIYVIVPSVALLVLRATGPDAAIGILFLFAVVWITDTAAYFTGRSLGGPRLWPRVSPGKTWSGALGGLAGAMALGLIVSLTGTVGLLASVALAALLSAAAQAGDLLESAVKRRFGAKDSGSIVPGHGGVLDRVDGVVGAATAAFILAGIGLGGGLFHVPEPYS